MKRRVYIFVNGIMCRPGDANGWNGRAVTWLHLNSGDRAEKLEYFCSPIGRAFFQKNRAEKLAQLIERYAGWEIVLVGHSNGTDLILEALALMDWPRIEAVHLVSGACEEDFALNGLNEALEKDRIGRLFVWMSGRDSALHVAKCRLGKFLGYGVLGLVGPKNVSLAAMQKLAIHRWPALDHSDCFKPYNFDTTMRGFIAGLAALGLKP
jgi:pimeloyl-ACP methyl ester carboxylesterase